MSNFNVIVHSIKYIPFYCSNISKRCSHTTNSC